MPDVFNDIFTQDDEIDIQQSWTKKDKEVVRESYAGERSLYRKTVIQFGVDPHTLLNYDRDSSTFEEICVAPRKGKHPWEWTQPFCDALSSLVCCPAFRNRPFFLVYTMRYALHVRAGRRNGRGEPSTSLLCEDRDKKFINRVKNHSGDLNPGVQTAIHKALLEQVGPDEPKYYGFIEYLNKTVARATKITSNPEHLKQTDVDAVNEAWNLYALDHGLNSTNYYKNEFNRKFSTKVVVAAGELDRDVEFCLRKKNSILWDRRYKIMETRQSNEIPFESFDDENVGGDGEEDEGFFRPSGPYPPAFLHERDERIHTHEQSTDQSPPSDQSDNRQPNDNPHSASTRLVRSAARVLRRQSSSPHSGAGNSQTTQNPHSALLVPKLPEFNFGNSPLADCIMSGINDPTIQFDLTPLKIHAFQQSKSPSPKLPTARKPPFVTPAVPYNHQRSMGQHHDEHFGLNCSSFPDSQMEQTDNEVEDGENKSSYTRSDSLSTPECENPSQSDADIKSPLNGSANTPIHNAKSRPTDESYQDLEVFEEISLPINRSALRSGDDILRYRFADNNLPILPDYVTAEQLAQLDAQLLSQNNPNHAADQKGDSP